MIIQNLSNFAKLRYRRIAFEFDQPKTLDETIQFFNQSKKQKDLPEKIVKIIDLHLRFLTELSKNPEFTYQGIDMDLGTARVMELLPLYESPDMVKKRDKHISDNLIDYTNANQEDGVIAILGTGHAGIQALLLSKAGWHHGRDYHAFYLAASNTSEFNHILTSKELVEGGVQEVIYNNSTKTFEWLKSYITHMKKNAIRVNENLSPAIEAQLTNAFLELSNEPIFQFQRNDNYYVDAHLSINDKQEFARKAAGLIEKIPGLGDIQFQYNTAKKSHHLVVPKINDENSEAISAAWKQLKLRPN